MNLTVYAYKGRSYVVDCGLAFAEAFEIGVDAHIPSPALLGQILGGPPEAYLVTHGHEDHIGALPYFLAQLPAPVYIGPWASELIKDKLLQRGEAGRYPLNEVLAGQTIRVGDIAVQWIHVPHSIPHSTSLVINAGKIRVFHTGDFKTKGYQPYETDLEAAVLDKIAAQGTLHALVADSTNAMTPGHCPSESTVVPELTELLSKAKGVGFVTTFSSNLWRVKTILQIALKLQKRVFALGAGMRKSLEIGVKLKLLTDEIQALVDEDGLRHLKRSEIIVLCSGCQGEHRSGMRRIVQDEVSFLRVQADDLVLFSSRVIPGNEKSIAKMVSLCHLKGATVITAKEYPSIHVSGHAYANDIKLLIERLKPRWHIPVHGTFTQMRANRELRTQGEACDMQNGSLISIGPDGLMEHALFELERLFLDSWSRLPMSYETMRARHKIGDSGLAIASGLFSPHGTQFEMECIGLPFASEEEEEQLEMQLLSRLKDLYERLKREGGLSTVTFNEQGRLMIRRILSDRFVKKPVVIAKLYLTGEPTHGLESR